MKKMKKMVALATLLTMFGSAASVSAQPYYAETGGQGYQESRAAPSLAPAIALGTIAVVAIVAVALQNSGSGSHSHAHD